MNITQKVSLLREGMIIPVVIENIAFGGEGVGRYQNQVVFVPYTAPEDEVLVKVTEVKKRHAHGIIHELAKPSPLRIAPRCSHFTQCGGCDYQHLSYPEQLRIKKAQAVETFRRIGGFPDPPVADVIPSPRPFIYRGKADFWIGKRDGQDGVAGFLRSKSRDIVDVGRCEIIAESLNQALQGLHKQGGESPVIVSRRQVTAWSWGREIGADVPAAALNDPVLEEALRSRSLPPDLSHSAAGGSNFIDLLGLWPIHTAGDLVFCGENIPRIVKGRTFLVPAYGFFQANLFLVEQLVDAVVAMCALTGRESVLDAYCGSGLFSMFLAPATRQVFGIELWGKAITCARENLERAGHDNADFIIGDAGEVMQNQFVARQQFLDVLVLDPPRTGCPGKVLSSVNRLRPKRIVYISCNPATQARDCRFFANHGYTLQSLQPFDMFPQTSHIEVVALLLLQEK
ncbi:MAG: class I SAM-dependent RNA methyltransferase [Deltaproteobacteria bacterium]|nr:class I SAM-dependent RNA methyltransferase [Deltaproteobacteria bacterium]